MSMTLKITHNHAMCMTSNYIRVMMSTESTPIYCDGCISIGVAYRSKIMSRLAINIYSPINLKKTFSTFFTELSPHYPRFGQFL